MKERNLQLERDDAMVYRAPEVLDYGTLTENTRQGSPCECGSDLSSDCSGCS